MESLSKRVLKNTPDNFLMRLDKYLSVKIRNHIITDILWEDTFTYDNYDHKNPSAKPELYRTLVNEKYKHAFLETIGKNKDYYDNRSIVLGENSYSMEIQKGKWILFDNHTDWEDTLWCTIKLYDKFWKYIDLWFYFAQPDTLDIVRIQWRNVEGEDKKKYLNHIYKNLWWFNIKIFMYLIASYIGFEQWKQKVRILKKEYSEFEHKSKGTDSTITMIERWLPIRETNHRYEWEKEDFLNYIEQINPDIIKKVIDSINTLFNEKTFQELFGERTWLQGHLIWILREKSIKSNV